MKKIVKKVFLILVLLMVIGATIFINTTNCADIIDPDTYKPGEITAATELNKKADEIIGAIQLVGSITSVIVLIIIGIKYLVGSVEERADYKETLMPYFIGAIMLFSITNILGIISSIMITVSDIANIENFGNVIITIAGTIGSITSVVVLAIIGIKFMLGSVEEKAQYKKSLKPYVIGCIFVFAASTIAGIIYSLVS